MLLDFSVDWRWVIGGTDVSPFVETWELAREQPDMGTPAWWRGKLVLRPVVGRDLNLDPLTNSLWRQGTSCSLTVAGYLVFTGSILLAYYDDWSTAPRLELEVGDVLAAKNHRQVIPFGEYNAQSLLAVLGIPGVAPAGDTVEISTDLTSPVKVVQELTWVTWLKERGLPATLFTRPDGQVDYVSPQAGISLTRTLEQVADFTRQRPALEIPGAVIASASLTYSVLPTRPDEETRGREIVFLLKEGDITKVTYIDSLGRVVKEETYRETGYNPILEGYAGYWYSVGDNWYELTKRVFIRDRNGYFYCFEFTRERGERAREQGSTRFFSGLVVAKKKTTIYWPQSRLFSVNENILTLAYLVEEFQLVAGDATYLLKLFTRAKGTTQDADSLTEAMTLSPTVGEILPGQQIRFPAWAQPPQQDKPPKPEKVNDVLSEEGEVAGFTGPPVYVTVPWLSVTVEEAGNLQQKIQNLRQRIRSTLRAAATWMAIEIGGRAFARRIKMPPPPEWLGDPRPWTLARIGNEVFWLVGETLRGTGQGVEFEATGILAGRPNTIPDSPEGIPFIPLVTVMPTRFPQVGIGCEMRAGEALIIPGDPWLGMAVEIEYAASDPAASVIIGIGVGELTEAWLGLTADATYEAEGGEDDEDDEDDSGSEVESLTLEAENGLISFGDVVYDVDASSCYAVEATNNYISVDFSVDSTSLTGERPIRLRVIYKSAGDATIDVYVSQGEDRYPAASFEASATEGYTDEELVIPTSAEPFDGITIDIERRSSEFRLDAIQLTSATGDWPPLNPCS